MMYEISLDGKTLYYPGDSECVILSPEIDLKMNDAGQAKMMVPDVNPLYDSIYLRKSMLSVMKNGREVFYGEVRAYERGFDRCRNLTAVGALSFLNDSRQPQYNYGNCTNLQFLTAVLNVHNEQMFNDNRKKIQVGYVTVSNSSSVVTRVTDGESTLEAIRTNLIGMTRGVLRLRHENGNLYLDYVNLSEYGSYCDQGIIFGENLMDYVENFSAEEVKTVIIPYGARIEDRNSEFEKRVDIKSVNSGNNYIVSSQSVINSYGYVWGTVVFDGVTDPSTLMNLGQTYLQETQWETAYFKLTAVDLAAVDTDISAIYFGDRINLQAESFNLNATYPIIEMTMKPLNPEDERIVVSANIKTKRATLTNRIGGVRQSIVSEAVREAQKIKQVIRAEIANIMATFEGVYGGYKLEEYDSNGLWVRTLYMDAPDKNQATNIMELSMRGIRFSTAGYAPASSNAWKLAITIDGKIASQEIFSNIVFANLLKAGVIQDVGGNFSLNLESGETSFKRLELDSPYLAITESGKIIFKNDPERLEIKQTILEAYANNTLVSTLDLANNFGTGDDAFVAPRLYSRGDIYFEIGNASSFYFYQNNRLCGFIDGNGWHGNYSTT